MTDDYNLHRFLDAQERVYDTILSELQAERKSSHWIWFIFPQIAGLGHRAMAQQFAITSLRSCMTLFLTAATDNTIFNDAPLRRQARSDDPRYPGPPQHATVLGPLSL